jgi:hypothetical protein
VGVGLWIRLGILETPVFQQLLDKRKTERTPIIEVIKRQPKEIILSALTRMSEQAPFFIFTAFIFAYGVDTLHMSKAGEDQNLDHVGTRGKGPIRARRVA